MADLSRLNPVFKWKLNLILSDLKSLGWQPKVASGVRTSREQAEKLRKGYFKAMHSWHVPGTTQIMPAGSAAVEEVYGSAADVVDGRYGWRGPAMNKDFQFWRDL